MRILIASDKFKGSLSAAEACAAIRRGIERRAGRDPELEITAVPIADGGEGMARAIVGAKGGEWIEAETVDALGRSIIAGYGWIKSESLAVIEMAESAGLWRLREDERDPWRASTFGVGIQIRQAIDRGAERILMGIGGSATNDGGAGMARAMGYRFRDGSGDEVVDLPADLTAVVKMDREAAAPVPRLMIACDVTNPVLGERGCTRTYGPQKGIAESDFDKHERRLGHWIALMGKNGLAASEDPGAGAAGGLGFGCRVLLKAELRPGFELIAEILDLEIAVKNSDLVITGEGRLDSQTLQGKAPAGIAAIARKHAKPTAAFAGMVEPGSAKILASAFDAVFQIAPGDLPVSQSMARGAVLLADSVSRNIDKLLSLTKSLHG